MKEIKVEWCVNWIKHTFENLPVENGGIECNLFWRMAEQTGLYVHGTYGSPMSTALAQCAKVEIIRDAKGKFRYNVFRLV